VTAEFLRDLLAFVEGEEARWDELSVAGSTGAQKMADRFGALAILVRESLDAQLAQ
jgi:hypothetical protein